MKCFFQVYTPLQRLAKLLVNGLSQVPRWAALLLQTRESGDARSLHLDSWQHNYPNSSIAISNHFASSMSFILIPAKITTLIVLLLLHPSILSIQVKPTHSSPIPPILSLFLSKSQILVTGSKYLGCLCSFH